MGFSQRILLISSNSSDKGGGERYLIYLTQGLQQLNCEVHVLLSTVTYMDGWAKELTQTGAIVHRLPLIGLRDRPLRFVQSIRDRKQQETIAQFCQQLTPDAILINQQYDEDGLDYIAGALLADVAPVGGTIHMPMTAKKNQRPLGKLRGAWLQKWYQQHPYHRIFVAQGGQQEFCNYYHHLSSGSVVHYGVPHPEETTEEPATVSSSAPSKLTIGFIGQFSQQKNLHLLVDSWQWLRQQGIDSKLMLIGDGAERASLEDRLIGIADRQDWQITGWQAHPEKYLSELDLYTMTSHFEGLPLALLEAVGRKLPAVVTNFNGAADVAQQAPWVTVVPNPSPQSVGQALQSALQNINSLKQQAIQGQADFWQYFSTRRMAQDTLTALQIQS
jgi:glycosyltransferase involved in cell wall biosynthesis